MFKRLKTILDKLASMAPPAAPHNDRFVLTGRCGRCNVTCLMPSHKRFRSCPDAACRGTVQAITEKPELIL